MSSTVTKVELITEDISSLGKEISQLLLKNKGLKEVLIELPENKRLIKNLLSEDRMYLNKLIQQATSIAMSKDMCLDINTHVDGNLFNKEDKKLVNKLKQLVHRLECTGVTIFLESIDENSYDIEKVIEAIKSENLKYNSKGE